MHDRHEPLASDHEFWAQVEVQEVYGKQSPQQCPLDPLGPKSVTGEDTSTHNRGMGGPLARLSLSVQLGEVLVQGQVVGVALSFLRNFAILSGASGVLGAVAGRGTSGGGRASTAEADTGCGWGGSPTQGQAQPLPHGRLLRAHAASRHEIPAALVADCDSALAAAWPSAGSVLMLISDLQA
ncbi:TPA: hypothetical protein ACH3X2_006826 [Trebouxia sp. C0005]